MGYTVTKSRPGVTPGGYTTSLNDSVATNAGTEAGTEGNAESVMNDVVKEWFDTLGFVARVGRGQTDTNRTYLSLFNHSGTEIFIYPNDAGNALTVTSVKP